VAQVYAFKQTTSAGFYTIVNPNSGKCVDVDSAGMADLTNIQIFTCSGGLNQAWEFVDVSGD
jgi:glucosylceramidase